MTLSQVHFSEINFMEVQSGLLFLVLIYFTGMIKYLSSSYKESHCHSRKKTLLLWICDEFYAVLLKVNNSHLNVYSKSGRVNY